MTLGIDMHLALLQRTGALSVALGHRPQPVNIPAEGSSAEPSPDMLPAHAAIVGSPTTTAPIMASIRRTRSNDDGMQVCEACKQCLWIENSVNLLEVHIPACLSAMDRLCGVQPSQHWPSATKGHTLLCCRLVHCAWLSM